MSIYEIDKTPDRIDRVAMYAALLEMQGVPAGAELLEIESLAKRTEGDPLFQLAVWAKVMGTATARVPWLGTKEHAVATEIARDMREMLDQRDAALESIVDMALDINLPGKRDQVSERRTRREARKAAAIVERCDRSLAAGARAFERLVDKTREMPRHGKRAERRRAVYAHGLIRQLLASDVALTNFHSSLVFPAGALAQASTRGHRLTLAQAAGRLLDAMRHESARPRPHGDAVSAADRVVARVLGVTIRIVKQWRSDARGRGRPAAGGCHRASR
jgi:hypothetical protein